MELYISVPNYLQWKSGLFNLWGPWISVPNFMGIHPVVVNTLHLNSHLMKSQKQESVTEVGRIHPLGTTNVCRWDIYSGFSLCVFSHGKEKVCESDVLVSFVVSFVFGVSSTGGCRGPIENRGGWLFLWFWCQMSEFGGILSSGSFTWCLCVILQSLSQDQP